MKMRLIILAAAAIALVVSAFVGTAPATAQLPPMMHKISHGKCYKSVDESMQTMQHFPYSPWWHQVPDMECWGLGDKLKQEKANPGAFMSPQFPNTNNGKRR